MVEFFNPTHELGEVGIKRPKATKFLVLDIFGARSKEFSWIFNPRKTKVKTVLLSGGSNNYLGLTVHRIANKVIRCPKAKSSSYSLHSMPVSITYHNMTQQNKNVS